MNRKDIYNKYPILFKSMKFIKNLSTEHAIELSAVVVYYSIVIPFLVTALYNIS